jgi:hypothetical protein
MIVIHNLLNMMLCWQTAKGPWLLVLHVYACTTLLLPAVKLPTLWLLLLLLQLGKTPWVAAWDRLLRVVLRLELRSGGLSRDSSALQEAFEAAVVSEQRVAAAPAQAAAQAAKAGSRASSSSGAAGSQAAKNAAAAAAAAEAAGAEGCTAEAGELCITAPELEEVRGCDCW